MFSCRLRSVEGIRVRRLQIGGSSDASERGLLFNLNCGARGVFRFSVIEAVQE